MTTRELMEKLEAGGFQFLKDKGGWACYDTDDRREVPETRHPRLGDAIYLAAKAIQL
jgi:predicted RNA binding protein YcfA (HicA-like mRNA interferase family)